MKRRIVTDYVFASILLIIFLFLFIDLISVSASAEDGSEMDEGGFHVAFMLLAGLLGLMATLSGMRNSRIKSISDLFPKIVPRVFHRHISKIYYLLFFGTFIAWSLVYYGDQGRLFFTLHGQIGLLAVILGVIGIATGVVMIKRPVKLWRLHWISNMGSFLLLILTMILGASLGD